MCGHVYLGDYAHAPLTRVGDQLPHLFGLVFGLGLVLGFGLGLGFQLGFQLVLVLG